MKLQAAFDEAVALANDCIAGKLAGNATAKQVLNILLTAGGNAFADGAAGAYLDDAINRGDQLVEELLLRTGVVLEGDAPRRRADFTLQGTDEPNTRPVTPREQAFVQVERVRHLVVSGIDPFATDRPVCWALELNRTLELHARAATAGCRRRALLLLLRARTDWFLTLLSNATGIKA